MKNKLIISILFLCTIQTSFAENFSSHGFNFTVEPIVGYEFTHLNNPSFHTRAMLIYGARFTVGRKYLSGEGEYTRGNSNESFSSPTETVNTLKENVRIGLRSVYAFNPFLNALFRGGGQASRQKSDTTPLNAVTQSTSSPWVYHPYAGLGLEGNISHLVSLSADATYVFNSTSNWAKNDVQTTVAFKIQLN